MPAHPQPPFDLVIFDNDGVLVDSEWHANGILAELLCEAGLPSTREGCIAEYMGSTMARVREIAELRLGRPLPVNLEDRYHERLFEAFRTKLTAVPGVADMLTQLTTPTCVASGGTHERIRLALSMTGLLPRFDGEDARAKVRELVAAALARPTPRRATRPTRTARERRIAGKKQRGGVKRLRARPGDWS